MRLDSGPLRPCDTCGGAGAKELGTSMFCWFHLQKLISTFNTITVDQGFGVPYAGAEDVEGAMLFPLRCVVCDASWMGDPLERCWWCEQHLDRLMHYQRELVLRPPDCELEDKRRPELIKNWVERLAVQVEAGTITKEEAKNAIERERNRTK